MATFYDWLEELAANNKIAESFVDSFGNMSEDQKNKAFEWLKMAYVSGYENAGGHYPSEVEESEDDVFGENELVVTENKATYASLLKRHTKRSLPKKKLIFS